MRSVLAAGLALLLLTGLAGCTSPCEELGNRLCECRSETVSKRSCEKTVRENLRDLDPSKAEEDTCSAALDSCKAPKDVEFCVWVQGEEGKIACGLALPPPPEAP
jgi:hypothetical protein